MRKLRRFSGESAAIARLHDEGQASLAPRQLDDYELERAMVSAAWWPCPGWIHRAVSVAHAGGHNTVAFWMCRMFVTRRAPAPPDRTLLLKHLPTRCAGIGCDSYLKGNKAKALVSQNESAADYQRYLSEGEGTASEEWRQDRSLNTESPRLHAALSGSLDSLRSSSGGVDVRSFYPRDFV